MSAIDNTQVSRVKQHILLMTTLPAGPPALPLIRIACINPCYGAAKTCAACAWHRHKINALVKL
jgi:hypothetical protein